MSPPPAAAQLSNLADPDTRELPAPQDKPKSTQLTGRPPEFTEEIADSLCLQLASGRSLRSICSANDMPGESTVYQWLHRYPAFADKYAHARKTQAEKYASEIIDIADDASQDRVTRTREDGTEYEEVDHEHINRAKLRVDSRKWIASKLLPKVYGDRQIIQDERDHEPANAVALLAQLMDMNKATGLFERMGIKLSQVTQTVELTQQPDDTSVIEHKPGE